MIALSRASASIQYGGENFEISYFLRPGLGEVILYLHGLGSSKEDFFAATETAPFQNYTICAFDFPGSGISSYSTQSLTMEDLVEITLKLCLQLKLRKLNVIGHSMGGLVALLLAAKYPERVRRLVSVEGNLAPEDCAVFSRRSVQADKAGTLREEIRTGLVSDFAKSDLAGDRYFADQFPKSVSTRAFVDYCHSIVDCSDNKNLLNTFLKLRQPKLFVHGSKNSRLSYIPTLKARGIEVLEVPQGGHWMFRDNPHDFFHGIHRFLLHSETNRDPR